MFMNVMGTGIRVAVPSDKELSKYQAHGYVFGDLCMVQTVELKAKIPNNPYSMLCQAVESTRHTHNWIEKTDHGPVKKMRNGKTPVKDRQFHYLKKVLDARVWKSVKLLDRTISLGDLVDMIHRALYYMTEANDLSDQERTLGLPYCFNPATGEVSYSPVLDQDYINVVDWFKAWHEFLNVNGFHTLYDEGAMELVSCRKADWHVFTGFYSAYDGNPDRLKKFHDDISYEEKSESDVEEPEVQEEPEQQVEQPMLFQEPDKGPDPSGESEEVLEPVVYPEGIHMLETMSGQEQQFFRVKAEATVNFSMQFSFTEHYLKRYVDNFNATLAPAGVTVRATGANFACVEFDRLEVCDGYPTAESMNFESIKEKAALVDMIYKILVDMHQRNRLYKQVVATGKTQLLDGAQKG